MKFTDGYWNVRDGVKIFSPVEVRDVAADDDSVTVYAACRAVVRRGDTLNEPLITLRYSSPAPDVIRVRISHHEGGVFRGPEFPIHDIRPEVTVRGGAEEASLTSGRLCVKIAGSGGWNVDYLFDGRRLTGCGGKSTGYIVDREGHAFIREQLDLAVGEYVYGLGERFTPFVRNGQTVDIWNEDGGTASEQAYKNVPFYMTNRGYGVFVNDPGRVSYEIASEAVSRVQFSLPGEIMEYFIIGGRTPADVLDNYTRLTGRPALPPAWSFGLWLTTSFTTSYDEATVGRFIAGMAERRIPLHVFHFDCFWMKEYQWCDFEWDRDVFPDPAGMLARLREKGLKICVWINPYIAQKSPLFKEGMAHGYLVRRPDGSVWQWDKWQAGMGLVDFTNPGAATWYQDKLRRLIDMGVDCFKTDFGERIPVDVVYHDGSDPLKMHNYYTFLYNRAVYDVLRQAKGGNGAVLFARSATAGSQQFPVHWGGDCTASYASMAETLRGGLSLGLCGFGFWSHDISGFEKTATPDVYKRWAAFGMLSSHSRLHGSESYRVPWLFGDEAVDVLRFFTGLKCRLMPYLYAMARKASHKGTPMMRAMVLEFPDDPACATLDRQYMLGDSLLVAPIFNDEGIAEYYLPAGRWTSLITGKAVSGGGWRKEKHGYFSLPVMARPDSIIAAGANSGRPDYEYADGVVFHVFELGDGRRAETTVTDVDGSPRLTVSAAREGNQFRIRAGAPGTWSVCLRNIPEVARVEGGVFRRSSSGAVVTPEDGVTEMTVFIS